MMKCIFFCMGLTIGGLAVECVNLREKITVAHQLEDAYHEGKVTGTTPRE